MAERPEDAAVERFERYLDALLGGGRPSPEDVADANEAEMARTAAELSGAVGAPDPDPAFIEQLRLRMRQADQGIASVQVPPPGSALRFSTAAFDGYVINDGGDIRALSSVCTHMGCTLHFRSDWQDLRCPCHGASFDLHGELANGRDRWRQSGGYRGDAQAYPISLPPLVRPKVKVDGDQVFVWTAQI
jgi:Rieske Fe-S protein